MLEAIFNLLNVLTDSAFKLSLVALLFLAVKKLVDIDEKLARTPTIVRPVIITQPLQDEQQQP